MPNIPQPPSQKPQHSIHTGQQVNVQSSKFPSEPGLQGPVTSSQPQQYSSRQQYASQQSMPMPSPSLPPMNFQPQTSPQHSIPSAHQIKGAVNSQVPSVSFPPSSQMHNPFSSPSSAQQHPHPHLQSHMPMISNQTQHSIQSSGVPHQPPLPSQPRPTSMQPFQHQHHSQVPHNMNYQFPGAPPHIPSQPLFHVRALIHITFRFLKCISTESNISVNCSVWCQHPSFPTRTTTTAKSTTTITASLHGK